MTFNHLHAPVVALTEYLYRMSFNEDSFLAKSHKVNIDGFEIGRVFQPLESFGGRGFAVVGIGEGDQVADVQKIVMSE